MKKFVTAWMVLIVSGFMFAAQAEEKVLYSGEAWVNKSKKTSGSWKVVEDGDKTYVVLGDKFKTSRGPDLKVFLFQSTMDEVGKKQKIESTGKLVAALDKSKGAQRYEIPAGVDLKDFKSLVIHCEKYTVVWGGVDLK